MPRKCCVPMCRSNYNIAKDGYVTTFRFPSNLELKRKWIQNVHRDNWEPGKDSVVCIKHFTKESFSTGDKYYDSKGTVYIETKANQLLPDAYPTVFEGLPSYLTSKCNRRKSPEERRLEAESRDKRRKIILEEKASQEDIVNSFGELKTQIRDKVDLSVWTISENVDCVCLLRLNFNNLPNVSHLLKIDSTLKISMFVKNTKIPESDLPYFSRGGYLKKWSQLLQCLQAYSEFESQDINICHLEHNFLEIIDKLIECHNVNEVSSNLLFFREQFELVTKRRKNYSKDTLILAFMLNCQSPAAYNSLRNNGTLILPHPKYLQKLASNLNVSPTSEKENIHFLHVMTSKLADIDKFVILSLDEVYVNPSLEYKNGKLVGQAVNNCLEEARTIQAFMVHSAYGSFKEVVSLTPVKALTGDYLTDLTLKVLKFVQESGLIVICIICDNSRVNKNMLSTLYAKFRGEGTYRIQNPKYRDLEIFLMFDPVHILKNIRNNWLNQKDSDKTLIFPDFVDISVIRKACFSDIRNLYANHSHVSNLLSTAFKLSYKTVYPNNLDRQKVMLVENLFHDTTIAALKTSSLDSESTSNFLEVINKWWHIINVKTFTKGLCKRDSNQMPFTCSDDNRLQFLKQFCDWVSNWNGLNLSHGHLTRDTSLDLLQTTNVLIQIIHFSFEKVKPNFVLLGKFQTDNLERRFGRYRQLSGCNYNISVLQVLENEKKIRIKSVLTLHSSRYGRIELDCSLLENYD